MPAPKTKYRPSLTADQIRHLINLARSESPLSNLSIEILGVLSPFLAKIENAGIEPAYTTSSKPSIEEKLGMIETSSIPKEEYWAECYSKWEKYGPTACTVQELKAVQEYKYLHNLMSAEEIIEFEKQ